MLLKVYWYLHVTGWSPESYFCTSNMKKTSSTNFSSVGWDVKHFINHNILLLNVNSNCELEHYLQIEYFSYTLFKSSNNILSAICWNTQKKFFPLKNMLCCSWNPNKNPYPEEILLQICILHTNDTGVYSRHVSTKVLWTLTWDFQIINVSED